MKLETVFVVKVVLVLEKIVHVVKLGHAPVEQDVIVQEHQCIIELVNVVLMDVIAPDAHAAKMECVPVMEMHTNVPVVDILEQVELVLIAACQDTVLVK